MSKAEIGGEVGFSTLFWDGDWIRQNMFPGSVSSCAYRRSSLTLDAQSGAVQKGALTDEPMTVSMSGTTEVGEPMVRFALVIGGE